MYDHITDCFMHKETVKVGVQPKLLHSNVEKCQLCNFKSLITSFLLLMKFSIFFLNRSVQTHF